MSPPDSHSAICARTVIGSVAASVRSCGSTSPSAASVASSARPVTGRPFSRWKRLSARRVFGPITPSAFTPSARWIRLAETGSAACAASVPPVWAVAVVVSSDAAKTSAKNTANERTAWGTADNSLVSSRLRG